MISTHVTSSGLTKFKIVNTSKLVRSPLPSNTLGASDEAQEKFSENMHFAMETLRKFIFRTDLDEKFIAYFLKNLEKMCVHVDPGLTIFGPSLAECSCASSGNFNRFERTRRQHLEAHILDRMTQPVTQPINYLSIGSGRLLQDLILLCKLIAKGYSNIKIHLVDELYESDFSNLSSENLGFTKGQELDDETIMEQVQSIAELDPRAALLAIMKNLEKTLQGCFQVNFYSSAKEYFSTNPPKCDIITAIDYDEFYQTKAEDVSQFMFLMRHLTAEGEFCLANPIHNFYFNNQRCTLVEFEQGRDKKWEYFYSGLYQPEIQSELAKSPANFLVIINRLSDLIELLPHLMHRAKHDMQFTIMNENLSAADIQVLTQMMTVFAPQGVNVTVKVIATLAECEKKYDVIFGMSADKKIKNNYYAKENFDEINNRFPGALIGWTSSNNFLMGFVISDVFYAFDSTENREALKGYKGTKKVIMLDQPAFYKAAIEKLMTFTSMKFDEFRTMCFAFGIFSKKACRKVQAEQAECVNTKAVPEISKEKDTYISSYTHKQFKPLLKGALYKEIGEDMIARGVIKVWRS